MATGAAEDAETASYESSSSSSEDNTVLISKKDRKKLQLKQQQREKEKQKEKGAVQKASSSSSSSSSKPPVASTASKADHICGICEKEGGDLYVCTGSCVSAYHLACLQVSSASDVPRDQWKCPHCVQNTHVCFHCKQLGLANGDATAEAASSSSQDDAQAPSLRPVVKCRALSCGKFYHQDCIATLPLARIAGSRFICPLHTCAACEQSGAKKEPVRCTRCPVAYHTSCLPRSGVLHLPGKRIICPKHEVAKEEESAAVETETAAVQDTKREDGAAAAVDEGKKLKKAPTLVDILNMEESRSVAASSPRTEENDDAQSDASATGGSSSKKHSKKDKKDKKKKKKKRKKDKEKKKDKDKDKEKSSSSSHRVGGDDEEDDHDDAEKDGSKADKAKKSKSSVKPERRNTVVSDDEDGEIIEDKRGEDDEQKRPVDVKSSEHEREAPVRANEVVKAEVASPERRPESLETVVEASVESDVVSRDERTEVRDGGVKMEALLNPPSDDVHMEEETVHHAVEEDRVSATISREENVSVEDASENASSREVPASGSPVHLPELVEVQRTKEEVSRETNEEDDRVDESRESIELEAKAATAGGSDDGGDEGDYDSGSGSQSGKAHRAGAKSAVDAVKDEKAGGSNRAKKNKKKKKGKGGDAAKRVGPGGEGQGEIDGVRPPDEAKWVQCDDCKKWRTVPKEIDLDAMPETWYCTMNSWNKAFASCEVPEEVVETKKAKSNKRSSLSSASEIAAPGVKKPKLSKQASVADVPAPLAGVPEDEDKSKATKKVDKDSKKRKLKLKLKEKYGDVKWVQCESSQCGKWRVVPLSIDFDRLPSVWYCNLNTWAPELASCSAANPIEVEAYLSKSQSKKPSASRPAKRMKGPEGTQDQQAVSAVATPAAGASEASSKSGSKSSKASAKSGTPTAHSSGGSSAGASSSVSNHSSLIQRHPSAGDDGRGKKVALEGVKSVVLEWAQCEKCNKWRKLPAHIKSSTLPDKWYCTMNHWDPARASCATPQEEDQEPVDASPLPSSQNWYPMPGQVGGTSSTGAGAIRSKRGKLSYSELLYASTGQLRKTYTSESSTLSFEYEGITYHRDDQYKGSSMYLSPLTTNKLTGENIEPQSEASKVSSIQFVAPATQELSDRVAKSILSKIDLRREFSITEIVDGVVTDSDLSVSGNNLSLSVITTAIAQLVSSGELEKVPAPRHHRPVDAASSTTILLGSLSSLPAYYRKVPKRPLKALKAWKEGLNLTS